MRLLGTLVISLIPVATIKEAKWDQCLLQFILSMRTAQPALHSVQGVARFFATFETAAPEAHCNLISFAGGEECNSPGMPAFLDSL